MATLSQRGLTPFLSDGILLFVTPLIGFRPQMLARIAPEILCQIEKIALGSAVTGEKWACASAAPNPEFCIPTSIAMARQFLVSCLKIRAIAYPENSPNRLWRTTAINMIVPIVTMLFTFRATTQAIIAIIARTEIAGVHSLPLCN